MTVFTEEQLLKATPIHPGGILDRSKIATGLDTVKKLYASNGYINFTCIPNLEIDEAGSKISLTIDVDEGRQFRMGHLFVDGLDPAKAASVVRAWPLRSGDVYLDSAVNEFFLHVGAIADPISSSRHVDEKNGRVNVELRFRPVEEGSE
jgi:outer membrane protein assembly factor BamA